MVDSAGLPPSLVRGQSPTHDDRDDSTVTLAPPVVGTFVTRTLLATVDACP